MSKVTLSSVGSLIDATTAQNTINANTTAISTAFDNTLSRDGTLPNTMSGNIDMNSNRILNLPAPSSLLEPARLQDVNNAVIGKVNLTYDMLPLEANATVLGNISGSTAATAPTTITSIMDSQLGSTRGSVAFRGASGWTSIAPGSSGQLLQTQGAGVDPLWAGSVAGTGTVTSVAAGNGVTTTLTSAAPGSAFISAGTLYTAETVNAQVGTTYTVADSDRAKFVSFSNASSIAVTLPQAGTASAFQSGWYADLANIGAGTVTVTPTTSTINNRSSIILNTNQSVRVISDGSNYQVFYGASPVVTVQKFTASGTYTRRPGLLYAIVETIGGGGGSAGCTGGSTFVVGGGGGGGGGYALAYLSANQIGATQTVTVGSGGTAGTSASNGGPGGTTSFGALCAATGGVGGTIGTTGTIGGGGSAGSGTTGDIQISGQAGQSAFYVSGNSVGFSFAGGKGGDSKLGFGGITTSPGGGAGNNGTAGTGFGAGGSGAAINLTTGTSNGAAGSTGICIVTEFSLQ